jgi:hypothetical protein
MNPFIYSGASNLDDNQILEMFILDYNYSRFILSKRNIFIWGERGSGKTMTLLYNKIVMGQKIKKSIQSSENVEFIPVYVSCITPLVFKREHLLLDNEFKSSVVSEHYLSLSIALALVKALSDIPTILDEVDQEETAIQLGYLFNDTLPPAPTILKSLQLFLHREFLKTQREINRPSSDGFYNDTYSFTSLVIPIMQCFRSWKKLDDCHFIFMMDDAHDLNKYQVSALNSWIAYRDNSYFSFKISAARISDYNFNTTSGGAILEGHDYVAIDMEQPYQNDDSSYAKLAEKIVEKRLSMIGIEVAANDFFPTNPSMERDIAFSKLEIRKEAERIYPEGETKKINDYIYKYARAHYFRNRPSKANRPPYSGFDTIVHLSSGVVRNLLEPCYVMYEDAISRFGEDAKIDSIDSTIQADVIHRLSDKYWNRLRLGLDKEIAECSRIESLKAEHLLLGLAELFRARLLDPDCSEPRAIAFSISGKTDENMKEIVPILDLCRRSQLIYKRTGSAKDRGEREDYYVPNRMLWPVRGLDPVGQHARVSIQANALLKVMNGGSIPYKPERTSSTEAQGDMFDE